MKTILGALIIGIGMMLWASVGTAGEGFTPDGRPVYVPDARSPYDKQRFEWQKEDRQNQKKKQEEMETKAQDARREAAYRESKTAHRKKVNKVRKKAGLKSHNSWQLNH